MNDSFSNIFHHLLIHLLTQFLLPYVIYSVIYIIILYSLSKLTELSELILSYNNFSTGLPSVIGELTTLKVLHLEWCQLADLPVRYVHCIYKFIHLLVDTQLLLPYMLFTLSVIYIIILYSLSKLTELSELILSYNSFKELYFL